MRLGVLLTAIAVVLTVRAQATTSSDHDTLGRSAFAAGRYRDAKAHFERALELTAGLKAEQRAAVLANLGQACQALGELARAEQLYRRALMDTRDHLLIRGLLGAVLAQQRRFEEAENELRRVIDADPSGTIGATARSDLATILEARGRRREAVELLEHAIGMCPPGQPRARMLANLGDFSAKLGLRKAAVAALRRSLTEMEEAVGATHPDTAMVLREYSKALRKAGMKQEAKQAAARAEMITSYSSSQTNANGAIVDFRDLQR